VTVLDGLPRNTAFLEELAKALKTSLGTAAPSATARSKSRATTASACALFSAPRIQREGVIPGDE